MPNSLTFLLMTQTQLARIDVHRGRKTRVKSVSRRARNPGESLATSTDAAIRLGPKKTGDVWVFSTGCWTGVVHLAADVAAALDDEELEQAVALEAETYSGISAFESRLGMKRLPEESSGEARWWVTQIAQSDWHDVDQTVGQFGGRLGGMGHAALPAFPECLLTDPSRVPQSWRLHQCFGEATISLRGNSVEGRSPRERPPRGRGWRVDDVLALGDLKTQRTRGQLLDWCEETTVAEESLAWITDQPLLDPPGDPS